MVVNPLFMLPEGEHLVSLGVTDAFERMFIDHNSLLTTPFHVSLNRLREIHRRVGKTLEHGTCGMGIGETVDWATRYPEWAIRMRDLSDLRGLTGKLELLRIEARRVVYDLSREWPEETQVDLGILEDPETVDRFISATQDLLKRGVSVVKPLNRSFWEDGTVIFEGAQGALLDEEWGFHPHTTWSNCTFENALKLVKQFSGTKGAKVTRLGVTRPYYTRHGRGPLPSEGLNLEIKDHNVDGEWQGLFRLGHFDFVMARYAKFIIEGLDGIAINHLDQVRGSQKVCIAHNFQGADMYRINFGIDHETHLGLGEMCKEYGEENEPVQSVVSAVYTELKDVNRLTESISRVFRAPVVLKGYGPTAEDKREA
jgi:adenylosuccinate synthase